MSNQTQHSVDELTNVTFYPTLGNVVNKVDNFTDKKTRKRLRRILSKIKKYHMTSSESVYKCGSPLTSDNLQMLQNKEHGNFSFHGVQTCDNVWACPVCRSKIISRRSDNIKAQNEKMFNTGLVHMTLTVKHSKSDSLRDLVGLSSQKTGVNYCLTLMRQSASWKKLKNAGYIGDLKVIETTYGKNGWHPHFHIMLYFHEKLSPEKSKELSELLRFEWSRSVEKVFNRQINDHGFSWNDTIPHTDVNYIAKWGAAQEVSAGVAKSGKTKNSYSIAELEEMLLDDSFTARKLLTEYYTTMAGHRMLAVSGRPDFRALFRVASNDEELGKESETDNLINSDLIYIMPKTTYNVFRQSELTEVYLLDLAEHCKKIGYYFPEYFKQLFPNLESPRLATTDEKQSYERAKRDKITSKNQKIILRNQAADLINIAKNDYESKNSKTIPLFSQNRVHNQDIERFL